MAESITQQEMLSAMQILKDVADELSPDMYLFDGPKLIPRFLLYHSARPDDPAGERLELVHRDLCKFGYAQCGDIERGELQDCFVNFPNGFGAGYFTGKVEEKPLRPGDPEDTAEYLRIDDDDVLVVAGISPSEAVDILAFVLPPDGPKEVYEVGFPIPGIRLTPLGHRVLAGLEQPRTAVPRASTDATLPAEPPAPPYKEIWERVEVTDDQPQALTTIRLHDPVGPGTTAKTYHLKPDQRQVVVNLVAAKEGARTKEQLGVDRPERVIDSLPWELRHWFRLPGHGRGDGYRFLRAAEMRDMLEEISLVLEEAGKMLGRPSHRSVGRATEGRSSS